VGAVLFAVITLAISGYEFSKGNASYAMGALAFAVVWVVVIPIAVDGRLRPFSSTRRLDVSTTPDGKPALVLPYSRVQFVGYLVRRDGVSVADDPDTHSVNAADEPNPKLVELSELLAGTWRVDGPGIRGQAEYQSKNGGRLLVAYVDFSVGDSRMRVIQHITHDRDRGTLLARYMDTMGDEATYMWVLEDRKIRVSLGEKN
jgi:hypothetical protein